MLSSTPTRNAGPGSGFEVRRPGARSTRPPRHAEVPPPEIRGRWPSTDPGCTRQSDPRLTPKIGGSRASFPRSDAPPKVRVGDREGPPAGPALHRGHPVGRVPGPAELAVDGRRRREEAHDVLVGIPAEDGLPLHQD